MPAKRPRRLAQAALAAILPTLAACAAPRSPLPPTDTVLPQLQDAFSGQKVVECLGQPLAAQRPCRDTIVQAMMVAIDLRYAEYEIGFFDTNRAVDFGASVTVLGLGAAGALAATGTSQVLSAISAAVTGTQEAFGRDLMAQQASGALLSAMRTGRNNVALRIRAGLQEPAERYPLGIALSDLYAYFRAGTLPGALASLTQITGNQAQITQDELRRAVPVATGEAARCLLGLISERSTPLRETRDANRRAMREAMTAAGVPAEVTPTDFATATGEARAAQQDRVARALGCRI